MDSKGTLQRLTLEKLYFLTLTNAISEKLRVGSSTDELFTKAYQELSASDQKEHFSKYETGESRYYRFNSELKHEMGEKLISLMQQKIADGSTVSEMDSRIYKLSESFNLSLPEERLLQYVSAEVSYPNIKELSASMGLDRDVLVSAKVLNFIGLEVSDIPTLSKSNLTRAKIIDTDNYYGNKLAGVFKKYLHGYGDLSSLFFEKNVSQPEFTLQDFHIKPENLEVLRELVKSNKPCAILIHGVPGSGKTEFAKALVKESGRNYCFIKHVEDDGRKYSKRSGIYLANFSSPKHSVVIVDEADDVLDTAPRMFNSNKEEKALTNNIIDNLTRHTIFILNDISVLDESCRRRFSFIQGFGKLDVSKKVISFKKQASLLGATFLTEFDYKDLASNDNLTPGIFGLAIKDVLSMGLEPGKSQTLFKQIILNKTTSLEEKGNSLNKVSASYDETVLKTSVGVGKVTEYIKAFYSGINPSVTNLTMLFSGPPGTGKTEFAKKIARDAGKELLVKRGSDLFGSYVGQTERNIKAAFAEAEGGGKILFLDEADSFFLDRESSVRSWESSQTNELLTQMENFNGVLICATNFRDRLDAAAMRRFMFKVEFNYLDKVGVVKLFKSYFARFIKDLELSSTEEAELSNMTRLTPGDFKTVDKKHAFDMVVDVSELISDLVAEIKVKEGKLDKEIKLA